MRRPSIHVVKRSQADGSPVDALEGAEFVSPVQPAMTAESCAQAVGAIGQAATVLELAPLGVSDESPVAAQAVTENGCDGNTLDTCSEEEVVIVPKVSCNLPDGEQPLPCSPSSDTTPCLSRLQKKGKKKDKKSKGCARSDQSETFLGTSIAQGFANPVVASCVNRPQSSGDCADYEADLAHDVARQGNSGGICGGESLTSDVTDNTMLIDSETYDIFHQCQPGPDSGCIKLAPHRLLLDLGDHASRKEQNSPCNLPCSGPKVQCSLSWPLRLELVF